MQIVNVQRDFQIPHAQYLTAYNILCEEFDGSDSKNIVDFYQEC